MRLNFSCVIGSYCLLASYMSENETKMQMAGKRPVRGMQYNGLRQRSSSALHSTECRSGGAVSYDSGHPGIQELGSHIRVIRRGYQSAMAAIFCRSYRPVRYASRLDLATMLSVLT